MSDTLTILIAGDTHDHIGGIRRMAATILPDYIFHVGDFGVWLGTKFHQAIEGLDPTIPLHFCDGNHEHFLNPS